MIFLDGLIWKELYSNELPLFFGLVVESWMFYENVNGVYAGMTYVEKYYLHGEEAFSVVDKDNWATSELWKGIG